MRIVLDIEELENREKTVWEQNPRLLLFESFRKLKEKYTAQESSDIIVAHYYVYDPHSPLRDTYRSEAELKKEIAKGWLDKPRFNWNKCEDIRDTYIKEMVSESGQLLIQYKEQLDSLTLFLSLWEWDRETASEKAKVLKDSKVLWKDYAEIRDLLKEEADGEESNYGGYQESFLEQYGE